MSRATIAIGSQGDQRTPEETLLEAGRQLIHTRGSAFTTHDVVSESGTSLYTFYRYFNGKDALILALLGQMIAEHCAGFELTGTGSDDPVARLEDFVRSMLVKPNSPETLAAARFLTSEHWRLHARLPREVWAVTAPVTTLVRDLLVAGRDAGTLSPNDPERDAWLITKILLGAFHHHAFIPDDDGMNTLADDVWAFCLAAVGGRPLGREREPGWAERH